MRENAHHDRGTYKVVMRLLTVHHQQSRLCMFCFYLPSLSAAWWMRVWMHHVVHASTLMCSDGGTRTWQEESVRTTSTRKCQTHNSTPGYSHIRLTRCDVTHRLDLTLTTVYLTYPLIHRLPHNNGSSTSLSHRQWYGIHQDGVSSYHASSGVHTDLQLRR